MAETIDFTNCRVVLGKAYNGANGKKIAVEYNGTLYMLKFPPSGKNKPTELSYTNSCFSEHVASSIFNLIGVKAHETVLGTFKIGGKEKSSVPARTLRQTERNSLISAPSRIQFWNRIRAAQERSLRTFSIRLKSSSMYLRRI